MKTAEACWFAKINIKRMLSLIKQSTVISFNDVILCKWIVQPLQPSVPHPNRNNPNPNRDFGDIFDTEASMAEVTKKSSGHLHQDNFRKPYIPHSIVLLPLYNKYRHIPLHLWQATRLP